MLVPPCQAYVDLEMDLRVSYLQGEPRFSALLLVLFACWLSVSETSNHLSFFGLEL